MTGEEILNHFYDRLVFERAENGWKVPFVVENWRGSKPAFDVVDAKTGEVVFAAGHKISPRLANKAAKDGLETLLIPTEEIFGRYSAYDLVNEATGEIYIEDGDEVSAENLERPEAHTTELNNKYATRIHTFVCNKQKQTHRTK